MPKFAVEVISASSSTVTIVESEDASEAVAHAYVALTIFMSRQPASIESVDVIISTAAGVKLAEISLAMRFFEPKQDNIIPMRNQSSMTFNRYGQGASSDLD